MNFWDKYYKLCISNGIKPNTVAKDLGFSSGVCTQWKNGLQKPSYDKASKIARYFGVTAEYLLDDEKETPSANNTESEPLFKASDTEWDIILNELSDESLVQLRDYTKYLLWKQDQVTSNSL